MSLDLFTTSDSPSSVLAEEVAAELNRWAVGTGVSIRQLDRGFQETGAARFGLLHDTLVDSGSGVAVCGMEHLPAELPSDLEISFVLKRRTRTDALISRGAYTRLPSGSTVACLGALRTAQMKRARKDLRASCTHHNTSAMLSSVASGKFDACVLPAYELEAIRYEPGVAFKVHELPSASFVPAAGQGAIAVFSYGVSFTDAVTRRIHDSAAAGEVEVERAILSALHPAEGSALGISCSSFGTGYALRIQLLSEDGRFERRLTRSIGRNEMLNHVLSGFSDGESQSVLGHKPG